MDHHNLVVIHFNQYSGGKFFINCLSHHPKVLPGLSITGSDSWILDPNSTPEQKHQRKITRIHQTLPPPDKMLNWLHYELGCRYFWGGMMVDFSSSDLEPYPQALELLQDHVCFLIGHGERFLLDSSNARHMVLHNSHDFQSRAHRLKNPDVPFINYTMPQDLESAFYLDVDNTYVSEQSILQATQDALVWLGLDQQQLDPQVRIYIQRYLDLHS